MLHLTLRGGKGGPFPAYLEIGDSEVSFEGENGDSQDEKQEGEDEGQPPTPELLVQPKVPPVHAPALSIGLDILPIQLHTAYLRQRS